MGKTSEVNKGFKGVFNEKVNNEVGFTYLEVAHVYILLKVLSLEIYY